MKVSSYVIVPLALVSAFVGFYKWDIAKNRGWHFGYYGQFNRVQSALATLPEVAVTDQWYHGDVGLEEFGFNVALKDGRTETINFSETDPVRKLSGDALKLALVAKLEKQISTPAGK